jgi:UDP:flavonoid glycosyltransferase YjiC (YdhE family)
MANIYFVPIPEFGHMTPPLKLARALKLRGHRVSYVGFADFEDYVRSHGLEYIPLLEQRYPKGYLNERKDKQAKMKIDKLSMMLVEAKEANDSIALNPLGELEKEIARVCRAAEPDLLIVDSMLRDLAVMASHKLGLPTLVLAVHFEEARIKLGAPDSKTPADGLPVIVLCPKQIDFSMTPKSENYFYAEASIELDRKEPLPFPWDELDQTRPLIYCSFGSQGNQYEQSEDLYRAIIEAMKEKSDWQLVLSIGPFANIADFQPVPENVLVVNWAPQLELLKRASIMINHGGLGAVKECIYFGVPMISYPGKWDQPNHTARLVYHGLGVRGNIHDRSARQVLNLIDTIEKNPSFKRRVEAMGEVFREIEGSGVGVKTVERILADYRDGVRDKRDRAAAGQSSAVS